MSEYQQSIEIMANADEVFEFVSSPENMPKFLPSVNEARATGDDQVHMAGSAKGHPYEVDGSFHLDPDERAMHWSSDGLHKYHGELHVTGDEARSTVSVHLTFEPGEKMKEAVELENGDADQAVDQALTKSLESIKQICEGAANVRTTADRGYLY